MKKLKIRHETVYSYGRAVSFGQHRMMFRPRDSHDLRLLDTHLTIDPPAKIRWMHDVFGNSIALATIAEQAAELRFESEILLEHYPASAPEFPVDAVAEHYPFQYPATELPDLMAAIERRFSDPEGRLDAWTRQFFDGDPVRTQDLLIGVTRAIQERFGYRVRHEVGTQTPEETLALGSGSCRDFALLMMETLRTLGLASRFVSGYLYDAASANSPADGASTHAWVQVYVPGAGWMEFDPTNGIVGGENLIRVAVARDPAQAVPLQGTFEGAADAFQGMQVDVQVSVAG